MLQMASLSHPKRQLDKGFAESARALEGTTKRSKERTLKQRLSKTQLDQQKPEANGVKIYKEYF
jgi:predicted negative regulator of RcsB-dependent stress response